MQRYNLTYLCVRKAAKVAITVEEIELTNADITMVIRLYSERDNYNEKTGFKPNIRSET